MPKSKATPKTAPAENSRTARLMREYDAEFSSLIDAVKITPPQPDQTGPVLNVQPPAPDVVSRLVNFLKKI